MKRLFVLPKTARIQFLEAEVLAHGLSIVIRRPSNPDVEPSVNAELPQLDSCACGLGPVKIVQQVNAVREIVPRQLVATPVPIPQHKVRRWMSTAYHLRIQKKWDKRFKEQTKMVPAVEHVVVSIPASTLSKIRKRLESSRH